MKTPLFATALFALLASSLAWSSSVVVVSADDWQSAFLASTFSQYDGFPIRLLSDPTRADELLEDVASYKPDSIYLFSSEASPAPALAYKLRSLGASMQEIQFKNHYDLAGAIAARTDCSNAVIVRDDFAFDALSAKHFAKKHDACVFFSKGASELPGETLAGISAARPQKIFVVGLLSQQIDQRLSEFQTERISGRDEYETSQALFLASVETADQAIITTGSVLDSTLLNNYDFPVLLVPLNGTYSLFKTVTLLKNAGTRHLLAIGRGISDTASWLRERADTKVLVKIGTMRATGYDKDMVNQDVSSVIQDGYSLPMPVRSGRMLGVRTDTFQLLDPITGNAIAGNARAAPPLYVDAEFENSGNIEYPVTLLVQVFDQDGVLIKSFESEARLVAKGSRTSFSARWDEPPSEGNYRVVASAHSDLFEGIDFSDSRAEAGVTWASFWLKTALFAFIFCLFAFVAAMALRTRGVQHKFKKSAEKIKSSLGNLKEKK